MKSVSGRGKLAKSPVSLSCDFEGAAPRNAAAVSRSPEGGFIIRAWENLGGSAETALGVFPRVHVRLRNSGDAAVQTPLRVDWSRNVPVVFPFDYGCFQEGATGEWTPVVGAASPTSTDYLLDVPPGDHRFALFPEYSVSDLEGWLRGLRGTGAVLGTAGRTAAGRPIRTVTLGSGSRCCVVQCRDHGYETAGSFAAEGIVSFLTSGSFAARYLLSKFRFVLLPMTNPDGVAGGLTRYTTAGADLNRVHTAKDPAHDVIRRMLDRLQPVAHMSFHHWQTKFIDGLLSNEEAIAERMLAYCPHDGAHAKHWRVEIVYDLLRQQRRTFSDPASKSWKNYVKEKFGGYAVTIELPWFLRSPDDMRLRGAEVFRAFLFAVIEDLERTPLPAPS